MLTVNVRPPLNNRSLLFGRPLRFYSCTANEATGYGRLGVACMEALNMVRVSAIDYPDFVLTNPMWPQESPIRFTMWEPDALPDSAMGFKNAASLIVPCSMNVKLFRNSGYRGPIHLINLWGEAPWSPLPNDSILKFISVGRDNGINSRKGFGELMEWFTLAFPTESDVRLTIKSNPECDRREVKDDRIEILYEDYSKERYEQMLSEHHCGVFLSGLEGWNFPAAELMAAGRPNIIIPWGGPADFTSKEDSWHLDYTLVQAPKEHPYFGVGRGAKPIKDSVIAAMREAYRNRDLLRKKASASYQTSLRFTKQKFKERLRVVALDVLSNV
jgi:glycosyltransferase involved in cell wall biosynthesis